MRLRFAKARLQLTADTVSKGRFKKQEQKAGGTQRESHPQGRGQETHSHACTEGYPQSQPPSEFLLRGSNPPGRPSGHEYLGHDEAGAHSLSPVHPKKHIDDEEYPEELHRPH